MVIVSFQPYIPKDYNAFCSATESKKQNPRERTLDLPFLFRYKHITSLKSHLSLAHSESFSFRFRGNFHGCVCFDLPVERISLATNRFGLKCQLNFCHYLGRYCITKSALLIKTRSCRIIRKQYQYLLIYGVHQNRLCTYDRQQ